jgi:hypothetical protein
LSENATGSAPISELPVPTIVFIVVYVAGRNNATREQVAWLEIPTPFPENGG